MSSFSLLKGVSLLALSSLISRLLGVYRDYLLADKFGASSGMGIFDLDTYYAAFRLPDLVFNVVVFGTVSAVFVPLFAEFIEKKERKRAWEFASIVLNFTFLVLFLISVLFFIFAPSIVSFLVPGFSGERFDITVKLTRLFLLSPIFLGLSTLFQSIANVFNKFLAYALAPILYNCGIIAGIFLFADRFGVFGIGFGVILGAVLHMLIQIPTVFKTGFKYFWLWDIYRKEVKELFRLFVPRVFGGATVPLLLVIDTFIASFLPVGSISILNYAGNLQSLPMGVFGLSFAIASFGVLSKLAVESNKTRFAAHFRMVMSNMLKFLLPASVGLYLIRYEIVSLILQTGKFTLGDKILTAQMLGILSFGIIFQSILPLFTRTFYALKNTLTPVMISFIALILSLLMSYVFALVLGMGVLGIAISSVIVSFFQVLVLYISLKKNVSFLSLPYSEFANFGLCTAFMGVVVWLIREYLNFSGDYFGLIFKTVLMVSVGVVIYFGALKCLVSHKLSNHKHQTLK